MADAEQNPAQASPEASAEQSRAAAPAQPRPPVHRRSGMLGPTRFMTGGLSAATVAVLQGALARLSGGERSATVSMSITPLGVRASAPVAATPFMVELSAEARELLGADAEVEALLAEGRLDVWIAGAAKLAPGSQVSIAVASSGLEVAVATATAEHDMEPIELSTAWTTDDLPVAFSIAARRAPPA